MTNEQQPSRPDAHASTPTLLIVVFETDSEDYFRTV